MGDYHCDRDEVKAMFRDGSDTPQDLRIVEDLGSSALDSGTIASYCSYFQRIRPNHPWRNLNDEDFLVRLQALARSTKDNQLHPTIAGLLMFGREYDIVREFANYLTELVKCHVASMTGTNFLGYLRLATRSTVVCNAQCGA